MSAYRPVVKLLQANTGARRISHVFDDFVEMFALTLRNAVDKQGWQEREDRYLQVVKPYTAEQLERFAEAFAHVVALMEAEPRDVLGHLYMSLDLGNEAMGQFYTPYDIARLMADMQAETLTEAIDRQGFATLYEPACGAGAFIVATAEGLRAKGCNPQAQLHVTAEDLSAQAVHMVYIHLTLLHIPAVVYRRDTLTMETFDTWLTPAHIIGGWTARLRNRDAIEQMRAFLDPPERLVEETVSAGVVTDTGALIEDTIREAERGGASAWDDVFAGIGGDAA